VRRAFAGLIVLVGSLVVPAVAHAHFILQEPENWIETDDQGSPQKTGPCGNEMSTSMETNVVTPYTAGQTITISIDETVPHNGHYRVALLQDAAGALLTTTSDKMAKPADPASSVTGSMCSADDMEDPPVFPVLADGMLEHTGAFGSPQTFEVTLPSDVNCEKCVLQVREFMSGHGAPCFYHHCAYISISGGAGSGAGGMSSGGAPAAGTGGSSAGGMSAGGAGGTLGQGGSLVGMGGMSAGGGMPGGGAPSAAGTGGSAGTMVVGAGGMTLPAGGQPPTSGGMPGTGGTGTGTGGTMTAAAGRTGTPLGTETPAEDPGCGCRVPARQSSTPFGIGAALALGLAIARRRRR
jgi:MYXO-CTERM domain-containing protein